MFRDIEAELTRISRLVEEALRRGQSEAISNNQGSSGWAVVIKSKYACDVLDDELTVLVQDFRQRKHIARMNSWLDDQHSRIFDSFAKHGFPEPSYDMLDKRIDEIKAILANKRIILVSNSRKDWVRFWIPVAISILALALSVAPFFFTSKP